MEKVSTLGALVKRPDAPTELLSATLRNLTAMRPKGGSTLKPGQDFGGKIMYILQSIAQHDNVSAADLKKLALDPSPTVREAVADNKNTDLLILETFLEDPSDQVVKAVIQRSDLPEDMLLKIKSIFEGSSDRSRLVLQEALTNFSFPVDIVDAAVYAVFKRDDWNWESDYDDLVDFLTDRLRRDLEGKERWAFTLDSPEALRLFVHSKNISEAARRRCFEVGVLKVQKEADERFSSSNQGDLPPLLEPVARVFNDLFGKDDIFATYQDEIVTLLQTHSLKDVPYERDFARKLEVLKNEDEDLLAIIAVSEDVADLIDLANRQHLSNDVALKLVANHHLPTEHAAEATFRHLRHSLTLEGLKVRKWDEEYVVVILSRAVGYIDKVTLPAHVLIRLVESICADPTAYNAYSHACTALTELPREHWLDVSYEVVRQLVEHSPALADEVLKTLNTLDSTGWETFTCLLEETSDFKGTFREFVEALQMVVS